jgi:hypothetical protein
MKSLLCILIAMGILFSGCSHTYQINPKSSDNSLAKMNKKLRDEKANLYLKDGQEIVGKNIQVRSDSTSWMEPEQEEHKSIATSQVEQIILVNRVGGAIVGLAGGLLVGGIIFGASFILALSGAAPVFEYGMPIGVAIAIISPIRGATGGSKEKYIFPATKDSIPQIDYSDFKRDFDADTIVISEQVGKVIDLKERNKLEIFPAIRGFQSAVFLKKKDGTFMVEIKYFSEKNGKGAIKWLHQDENIINMYKKRIEKIYVQ